MRLRCSLPLTVLLAVVFSSSVQADVLHQTFEFPISRISQAFNDGYDQLYMNGCDITDAVGCPQLPVQSIHLALPPGARVDRVDVVSTESEYLPGTYRIYPAQPPRILSRDEKDIVFILPDSSVYGLADSYPGKLVEPAGSGGLAGYQVAGIKVYPLQYEPQRKRVKCYTKIEAAVTYTTDGGKPLAAPPRRPPISS